MILAVFLFIFIWFSIFYLRINEFCHKCKFVQALQLFFFIYLYGYCPHVSFNIHMSTYIHSSVLCRSIQDSDVHSSVTGTPNALVSNSALRQKAEWPLAIYSCRFNASLMNHLATFIDMSNMFSNTFSDKQGSSDGDLIQVENLLCTQLKKMALDIEQNFRKQNQTVVDIGGFLLVSLILYTHQDHKIWRRPSPCLQNILNI